MGDSVPSDPYRALGVPREATAAIIKTAYKKAALRCHPDKVKDKTAAADEFHKINQAYELLIDPEKRQRYEDQLRNAQLRREAYEKRGGAAYAKHPNGDGRSPGFGTRSPPSQATPFSAQANGRVYEERRPKDRGYYEEETRFDNGYFPEHNDTRASSRKYDGYAARPPPRPTATRAQESRGSFRTEKVSPKYKEREEVKKRREQETKRARSSKFSAASVASDTDSSEEEYFSAKRRQEQGREWTQYRRREAPRKSDEFPDELAKKYSQQEAEVRDRMRRERVAPTTSPSPPTDHVPPPSSYREQAFRSYQEPESRRPSTRDARPGMFRRSSKSGSEVPQRPMSSGKDGVRRGSRTPEDVPEPPTAASDRRPGPPPNFYSSPALAAARTQTRRSQTTDEYPLEHNPRNPGLKRAETMPTRPTPGERTASNRSVPRRADRPENTPLQGSKLKHSAPPPSSVDNNDSGYSTSSPSETPQPEQQAFRKHTYSYGVNGSVHNSPQVPDVEAGFGMPGFAAPPSDFGYGNGHSTVFREPGFGPSSTTQRKSPSPPPPTRQRASSSASKYTPAAAHHDRERGPPPSRSAYTAAGDVPPHPGSAPSSRRPSIHQANSSQQRVPGLNRGATMPPVSTSGGRSSPHVKASPNISPHLPSNPLFGEVFNSATDLRPSGSPVTGPSATQGRRVSEDTGRYARHTRDEGRYAPGAQQQGARRSNENVDRTTMRKSNDRVDQMEVPSRSRERERERERGGGRERSGSSAKLKERARGGSGKVSGGRVSSSSSGRSKLPFGLRRAETAY